LKIIVRSVQTVLCTERTNVGVDTCHLL
jgi:hypothetical protein